MGMHGFDGWVGHIQSDDHEGSPLTLTDPRMSSVSIAGRENVRCVCNTRIKPSV